MAIEPGTLFEFAKALGEKATGKSGAKLATVTRVDKDGTVYVTIPGGATETPIATTGAVISVGDIVSVSMQAGKLRADGNISEPAVSRNVVNATIKPINKAVEIAKKSASEAEAVANAVNQHFWDDGNGAHVTDVTKDEWTKAVEDEFSDLSQDKQYPNVLLNSLGMLLRSALNNLVSITRSAIAFYDGNGNTANNIVASFGAVTQIGKKQDSLGNGLFYVQLTDEDITFFEPDREIETAINGREMSFASDAGRVGFETVAMPSAGGTTYTAQLQLQANAVSGHDDSEITLEADSIVVNGRLQATQPLFKVITASSTAQSITANNGKVISFTASIPTGYTLIGIGAVNHTHNLVGTIGAFTFSGSTISVAITNRSNANWSDEVVTVRCICAWTGIV